MNVKNVKKKVKLEKKTKERAFPFDNKKKQVIFEETEMKHF